MDSFGKALRRLRQEKGISQQKLADTFELQRTTITNYESGKSLPNLELFVQIVKFFGVSSDSMLGLNDRAEMNHYDTKQSLPHYITDGSKRLSVRRPEVTLQTPEEQAHIVRLENKVAALLTMAGNLSNEIQELRSASL